MAVFNNRLYVATNNSDGVQVWRTNGSEPRLNDWTLIVDKGFGDKANKYALSIGIFNKYLYVSGSKTLPLSCLIPLGCDIIRINKYDDWELVVGGPPIIPSNPSKGYRNKSLSGLYSGFNNPFNVYAWQMQQYNNKLLITTFDDSTNMEVILDTLLLNRYDIENEIGEIATNIIIGIYKTIVRILSKINYPFGFDFYESNDGINFSPVFLNGFNNRYNYGGRILFVDSSNTLYVGTANPFQGCEVWKMKSNSNSNYCYSKQYDYSTLANVQKQINSNYELLKTHMPTIMKFLPKELYHKFL